MERVDVLVAAGPGDTQDAVLAAAAAQELTARAVTNLEELAAGWRDAGAVFIADDLAERVVGRALPHRPDVFLVGADERALTAWSAPLGARVIGLPAGAAWLGVVLGGDSAPGLAPVVAVVGGAGGVGASTLAGTLACLAATGNGRAALVDADLVGGGIDLLLGAEQTGGWRWPRLTGAQGHVGDLRPYLPVVDGVSLVSMARGPAIDLARDPMAAILGSLRRGHDLVVVDPGRSLTAAARESLRLATRILVVVQGGIRAVAAAREVVRAHQLESAELVLRRASPGITAAMVADAVGLPVVAELPDDRRLPAAAERGLPPLRAGRRYQRACRGLLARVMGGGDG
ncbi:MAG: P-loop NTPase [Propionicimonas sp.]|nr:P-loop NTPase [Propionicimonas sp.]